MTNIIELKEKLKNILDFLEKFEDKSFSKIDKDILLQMLRDYYIEVTEISEPLKPVETFSSVKTTEPENEKKHVEQTKVDTVEDVNIDFVDKSEELKTDFEDMKTEEVQQSEMPSETKKDTNVQPTVKKNVPEQTSLFGSNNSSGVKTIGEKLGNNKTSINEILAQKNKATDISSRLKPVTDIKSAIGVGDRFLFVRELFAGNSESFDETITHLNSLSSYQEACDHIKEKFNWDNSQSTVISFMNIVKRRYV